MNSAKPDEKPLTPAQIYGRIKPKPGKRPRGRPKLDDAEKQRRNTLQPCRVKRPVTPDRPVSQPAARDYLEVAREYAVDVRTGRVVTCKWVRLAVERQERDLRAQSLPACPWVWSPAHATAACAFLEQLPHVEGAWGTGTIRLEPWQVFLVTALFGWRHRTDLTRRRFTSFYLELGRKGAKSTLMAGLALFHLLREDEPGAMVICGATTGSQARIVFAIAQKMVHRALWLRQAGVEALANAIVTTDASMKPINAKASTQDGLNPSCIVLDESHAQTFKLHDVLKSAQGARKNPLMLCPTTAGYDLLSVGYALRTMVTKVLEGVVEVEHLLGIIYTLDEGDDWRDEATWIKANPMIGITPSLDWVRNYRTDAMATPGLEGEFRVKVCSEWASASSAWLSLTAWDRCADPTLRLEAFAGESCWIGGDLANRDDLASVALLFERDELLIAFVRIYFPELMLRERARSIPEYRRWVDQGILTLTPGNFIDYATIETDIRAWCAQFAVRDIAFDEWGSTQLVGALANEGRPARTEPKNAKTVTPPALEFEARVNRAKFRHDGNSCLRWQASNVVVSRRRDNSLLPHKEHDKSPHKIDAIDAVLKAIGGWIKVQAATPQYSMVVFG
jgi:phage terminase large subunit-like protein